MSRPESLVCVIGSARPGGAEGQLMTLAGELRRAGRDVSVVFLYDGGPLTAGLDRDGVPWRVMCPPRSPSRAHRWAGILLGFLRLAKFLRRSQPDIVMAWLSFAIWPALLISELTCRARRVAGIRGELLRQEVRWSGPLLRRALRRAHLVVVNSPTLTKDATDWGAHPDRLHVVPNGLMIPSEVPGAPTGPPEAVVVANFKPLKGHAELIAVAQLLTSEVVFRLVGDGPLRPDFLRQAEAAGVSDRFILVTPPANVMAEISRSAFAVHPSLSEGLSNAILEELALGRAVVAFDVGGNPYLVNDGENGCLVHLPELKAMAAAIDRLAGDADLRGRMGAAARDSAEAFAWDVCRDHYIQLFATLRAP